jgi:hypothetical protein
VTIHRLGPDPDAVPRYRVDLGRILVTIDDIESLMTYLGRNEEDSDNIVVEFNAGYFTKAKDLSKISPAELDLLLLKNSKVQVILNTYSAAAIGDFQEAQGVSNSWAESLETKQKPPRVRKDEIATIISASVLLILSVIAFAAFLLTQNVYLKVAQWYLRIGSAFSLLGVLVLGLSIYILYIWDKRFKKSSYAIVVPHTRDEYRRNELSQKYPRRAWIVAIIAAAIAAVSIAVNVWLVVSK